MLGSGVQVRDSTVIDGGLGLFAMRSFDTNMILTEYDGKVISRSAALQLRDIGLDTHTISIDH